MNVHTMALAFSHARLPAHDNVIEAAALVIETRNSASVDASRNDFLNVSGSFLLNQLDFGGARCNWWGSAGGPLKVPASVPTTFYTPFASAPIAGTSTPCP